MKGPLEELADALEQGRYEYRGDGKTHRLHVFALNLDGPMDGPLLGDTCLDCGQKDSENDCPGRK